MKQVRLEALRLAVASGAPPGDVLDVAADYARYIEDGPVVVDLPQPNLPQRRRRRTKQEMEDARQSQSD